MPLDVFGVVLAAAVLHAVWNAIVRGAGDTLLTTVLVAGSAALIGAVALPLLPPMASGAWVYLAVSGLLEIAYYALIAAAYRATEMSRSYPLMRGTAPLLVVLASTLLLGVHLSVAAWAGVLLLCAGILALSLDAGGRTDSRGLRFALLNAAVIAAYTLVDGYGVRVSGAAATYTMWIFLLTGAPLLIWALVARPDFPAYARRNWYLGLAGGVGTLASYGLVLWAMTQAPVPLVAALRETSIVFGTAIAAFVLRERVTARRVAAVLVIAAGAVVLRLA